MNTKVAVLESTHEDHAVRQWRLLLAMAMIVVFFVTQFRTASATSEKQPTLPPPACGESVYYTPTVTINGLVAPGFELDVEITGTGDIYLGASDITEWPNLCTKNAVGGVECNTDDEFTVHNYEFKVGVPDFPEMWLIADSSYNERGRRILTCRDERYVQVEQRPVIASVNPFNPAPGQEILITGKHFVQQGVAISDHGLMFTNADGTGVAYFEATSPEVFSWSENQIRVKLWDNMAENTDYSVVVVAAAKSGVQNYGFTTGEKLDEGWISIQPTQINMSVDYTEVFRQVFFIVDNNTGISQTYDVGVVGVNAGCFELPETTTIPNGAQYSHFIPMNPRCLGEGLHEFSFVFQEVSQSDIQQNIVVPASILVGPNPWEVTIDYKDVITEGQNLTYTLTVTNVDDRMRLGAVELLIFPAPLVSETITGTSPFGQVSVRQVDRQEMQAAHAGLSAAEATRVYWVFEVKSGQSAQLIVNAQANEVAEDTPFDGVFFLTAPDATEYFGGITVMNENEETPKDDQLIFLPMITR